MGLQSPHLCPSTSLSFANSSSTPTSSLQYSLRTIASVDGIGPQAPAPILQTPSPPPSFTTAIHTIPPIVTPNLITHSMEAPPSAANK
ncbi:hypothetical protein PBY51_007049 [Eleginops maclovinus]|uniref:Uncharacterized protein n=1 Tax=Eleginops maclovinus TaxID=56733 RepID=A0AAN8AET1_ELEMC|nr:hypothetical protein PBY51_007049 [Eleginops maclovinus]